MADKDTRDDADAYGETPPPHEVPRSEGRSSAVEGVAAPKTEPDPTETQGEPAASDVTPSHAESEQPGVGPEPRPEARPEVQLEPELEPELAPTEPAFVEARVAESVHEDIREVRDQPASDAPGPDAAAPASDISQSEISQSEPVQPEPEASPCWRSAIADALVDPPASAQTEAEQPAASPVADDAAAVESLIAETEAPSPEPRLRAPIELLPARIAPSPEPSNPAAHSTPDTVAPPVQGEAPGRAETAPPQAQPDTFTQAAEDLFRPPTLDRDPHLITIGRRLEPGRLIPRPTAPVIERTYEPSYDPAPEPARPAWKTGTWKDRLWIAGRYAAYAVGGYLALVVILIFLFRFIDPPGSMLMLTKLLTGNSVSRTWVPLENISPNLVRAVIVSEDGRFCEHSGVDTVAIREAIERASGGVPRGASTISMQLTKNLFLWNAKSYIRKIIEVPLTLLTEIVWPKWRILEIYLNVAEWGPGIFGAEAAARHHFGKPAARLNEREAALLAAVLPNPVVRNASAPNTLTSRKARVVQSRVRAYGAIAACAVTSSSADASAPAAATAGAAAKAGAAPRNQPAARKTPPRRGPRQETIDDWAPVLRMGPQ